MEEELPLPCGECCAQGVDCCQNPRILWTMAEASEVLGAVKDTPLAEGLVIFKSKDVPGMVHILRNPKDMTLMDHCAFWDYENKNCGVYEYRPSVCRVFGDRKYIPCPYDNYREPGAITELVKTNPKLANDLHNMMPDDPAAYARDYVVPWVEQFKLQPKEVQEYWESLNTVNFISKDEHEQGKS